MAVVYKKSTALCSFRILGLDAIPFSLEATMYEDDDTYHINW